MMKKGIALLLCMALALSFAGCAKSGDGGAQSAEPANDPADTTAAASASASNDIDDELVVSVPKGYELKVAFDQDNAPFSYVDKSGNLVGLNVDIAKAVCERQEWTLNAQAIDWSTRQEVLSKGEVDCVWGGVSYSETVALDNDQQWYTYGGIFVDAIVKDGSGMSKLSDLKGKKVEVEPGALFALEGDQATELGKQLVQDAASYTVVADATTAYNDLVAGNCDAIVTSRVADDAVDYESYGDDVTFQTLYDVDVYSAADKEEEESTEYESETVESNSICDINIGPGCPSDTDVYYVLAQTIEDMLADGQIVSLADTWSQADNGAYKDMIGRCSIYGIVEYSPEDFGDASVDGELVEELDLSELADGSAAASGSNVDVTVES